MTVAELITALRECNPDATVAMLDGFEVVVFEVSADGNTVYLSDFED